jgi:hypothetical protein
MKYRSTERRVVELHRSDDLPNLIRVETFGEVRYTLKDRVGIHSLPILLPPAIANGELDRYIHTRVAVA